MSDWNQIDTAPENVVVLTKEEGQIRTCAICGPECSC